MSAKSAVTILRSPSATSAIAEAGSSTESPCGLLPGAEAPIVESFEPHLRQNFDPGGLLRPQDGHIASSFAPHSVQNAASGRLSLWHLAHSICGLARQFVE